jgi:3-hydroxyacyl-CoA dehydrogenase/enoyl-CoA hydratase/3-hydroxybutyryl-CoA epimerase
MTDPNATQTDMQASAAQETTLETRHWQIHWDRDGIGWLHFDYADGRTNVLSTPALREFNSCLEQIEHHAPTGLVIVSDKRNGFIAGADVREFTHVVDEEKAFEQVRLAQNIFDRLAALPFPTVSIIHGFCLGGGTELALACRYRVARNDAGTRLGLPEVRLGIHPGFGGTVRLPPLVGTPAAMDMMLSGRSVDARTAARIGLVNHAVPEHSLESAARSLIDRQPRPKRPWWLRRLPEWRPLRPVTAALLRRQLAKRAAREHYPAPYALIDLWQHFAGQPDVMMVEEARSVARLLTGETAQNLLRVFFLQERLKGLGRQAEFRAQHVHVVGAGTMGGDIAAWCALRGLKVTLQDRTPAHIAPAMRRAHTLFGRKLRRPRAVQAAMDRLIPDAKGAGIARADVLIEAIFEDLNAKQALFRELEPHTKSSALIATNTSSIPLEELGANLLRPERLVGLHFFNPVDKMQLVEVVAGNNTSPESVHQAAAFARQIDRLPLPVRSTPGFLVNRILMPYLLEAVALTEEGVPAALVDRAAVQFGMPMGPLTLADTVGLDVCLSVAQVLAARLGTDVPESLRSRVRQGRLGRKSGGGFYDYRRGKQSSEKPPRDYRVPHDLDERLILRLVNEAAACLREQVVEDADLLDAGVIFGTGFAPFRGGPLHYAGAAGAQALRSRLLALEHRCGDRFSPDPSWSQEPARASG